MPNLISVGQIIDKTWEHYVKHFQILMKISLWALVVAALMLVRIFIIPEGETLVLLEWINNGVPTLAIVRFIVGALISLIAIPVIVTWIFMTLVQAIRDQANGKPIKIKAIQKKSWKNFFRYVLVILLKTLVILSPLLLMVPGVLLTIFNEAAGSGSLLVVVALILITAGLVAALYFVVKWGIELSFAGFEMLLTGKNSLKALAGSRTLIKGRYWKTLIRILIPKVVLGIFVVIGEILIAFTSVLISVALFDIGEWFGIYGSFIIITLLAMALRILYVPIFIVADYFIYDSLRKSR
ncbi:hypothetical protein CO057_03530 [Candidatus Uhrbacteria bacterium CG_4_9_14_0_2_um_filter_41_50]|uniref:Glycerophosphoryl diester phosphodiesterase membrane domain-containing protein n=1 Tax=Candidatus Uhrbacteria bacterium CG_4_9_14_0_2_um_filter_41_50 TaxID=1975031 RepID=A0A2M8ENR0_9BACT|nr:MAG: hypothetical protein COZ45_02545 [Candidatus Uhrbacteria bacterium CG_4_10_14_3_um_filter_41_21]PIZ54227.1 MAG: hypothetical protein COY24_04420 [Candidatus Uhrbacteria bacterium CG_4_10_14_0_2_um_filter_41_21]PJB84397.1 MAG: hypothetical protein CO086_03510 [Candidatus Uhrbacteria bacterium CG_4_9_14_0_8_um_filter_41_16]PJC24369.1 MAG: hypothetical protein CO057_03530 [Candidatus Uhrbacteria bacterium CG_4_9_14_0_2_um_filter_41_50]PJE75268.1 MAG: hypothetical protein COV03_00675 [Candi